MQSIQFEDNPYLGRTATVPWQRPYDPLACKGFGSSLHGRREGVRRDTTNGIRLVTEVFRCRCGRGRHVRREVVA